MSTFWIQNEPKTNVTTGDDLPDFISFADHNHQYSLQTLEITLAGNNSCSCSTVSVFLISLFCWSCFILMIMWVALAEGGGWLLFGGISLVFSLYFVPLLFIAINMLRYLLHSMCSNFKIICQWAWADRCHCPI
eukprot:179497_1